MNIRTAAFIAKNDKILTMHYEYGGQAVYNLPGGNLDFGESLEECLKRELKEELGVEIAVKQLYFVFEALIEEKNKSTLHLIYEAEIMGDDPVLNPKETSALELKWLPLKEIAKVNIYPNIGKEIEEKSLQNAPHYLGRIIQPWLK